jgi:hypothetical protein
MAGFKDEKTVLTQKILSQNTKIFSQNPKVFFHIFSRIFNFNWYTCTKFFSTNFLQFFEFLFSTKFSLVLTQKKICTNTKISKNQTCNFNFGGKNLKSCASTIKFFV